MKAIVNTGIGKLELLEIPLPEPCEGQVRIRTAATGICATDLTVIDGCTRSKYPQIPGHEWSGFIDKAGVGVSKEIEGKLCVAENVISDGGEVGFEHPGAYGEYFVTEAANVRILPKSFPVSEAALIEPLAVCVRGIRCLRITYRKSALIFGDGPVGQIMLMLLVLDGVDNIVLVGGRKGRLETAVKNGASAIVNSELLIRGNCCCCNLSVCACSPQTGRSRGRNRDRILFPCIDSDTDTDGDPD